MKYEMIFGDERLFDGAPIDCIFVVRLQDGHKIYYGEYPKITTEPLFVVQSDYITFAMRRIIKTPVWTVADQKAGRLPEVGSIFTYRNETLTCHFIDCNNEIWAHDIDNNIVTPVLRDCRPIETPTEKAQRLEDEFFEQVKLGGMNANTPQKTSSLFELGVRAAYRKHLELAAPKGDE